MWDFFINPKENLIYERMKTSNLQKSGTKYLNYIEDWFRILENVFKSQLNPS